MKRRSLILALNLAAAVISPALLLAETIAVVNRTGESIELIQAAGDGEDRWSDDLIPGQVLLDGESVSVDLAGLAPWSFRMVSTEGRTYVLYGAGATRTGKMTVGPEHLAELAQFAGAVREVTFTNRTGAPITSLRASAVGESSWGADLLENKTLRDGKSATVILKAAAGTMNFDIQFSLISGNTELTYEKEAVILTDGASLVLSIEFQ